MATSAGPIPVRTPAAEGARRQGFRVVMGVSALVVSAGAVLASVDPNQPGHYPTCPFLAITGYYCPGCGSLRAMHDLLTGDVSGALARNPLAVLFVPYLLLAWYSWAARRLGRPVRFNSTQVPVWMLWALLAFVLGFWVLRNLPGWTWLSPA